MKITPPITPPSIAPKGVFVFDKFPARLLGRRVEAAVGAGWIEVKVTVLVLGTSTVV